MKEWLGRFLSFWFDVFSESGESGQRKGSWSRVGSAIALLAVLMWVNYIVHARQEIPELEGPIFFVCSIYAIGKITPLVSAIKSGKIQQ